MLEIMLLCTLDGLEFDILLCFLFPKYYRANKLKRKKKQVKQIKSYNLSMLDILYWKEETRSKRTTIIIEELMFFVNKKRQSHDKFIWMEGNLNTQTQHSFDRLNERVFQLQIWINSFLILTSSIQQSILIQRNLFR